MKDAGRCSGSAQTPLHNLFAHDVLLLLPPVVRNTQLSRVSGGLSFSNHPPTVPFDGMCDFSRAFPRRLFQTRIGVQEFGETLTETGLCRVMSGVHRRLLCLPTQLQRDQLRYACREPLSAIALLACLLSQQRRRFITVTRSGVWKRLEFAAMC